MQTNIRKSVNLKACPRCGGDVCRMRDTFGVYHQCAQCGRDIRREVAHSPVASTANAGTMDSPAHPERHREKLIV
jgi:uncharacterized protein (DUF983 family)